MGRNLGALKAELGAKARGAFQALAGLKVSSPSPSGAGQGGGTPAPHVERRASPPANHPPEGGEKRYTAWTFGELPELMEIRKGGTSLVGFPALIDKGDAVAIEVFDEPEVAAAKHRGGLRRLFALQLRDALKYLEKNIPDLQKMAVAFMPLGTQEELREQILEVALDRAFLLDPLPANAADFQRRLEEGRGRLTLIANEVARLAATILADHAAAARKIKDTKIQPEATADALQQLQRLVPKRFLAATPWTRLQHLPRYLKAIVLRLDKLRADPARDSARLAELKPQEQRYWRLVAERKGHVDERMEDFRWLLEELRVSFFAQELRTPQPVSIKRLEKVWSQLQG
jgi:ATP-dependent helicase HrpA